ncbi:MAG: hypothetical protein U0232_34345 [Thermomicrobiales bacterium]
MATHSRSLMVVGQSFTSANVSLCLRFDVAEEIASADSTLLVALMS